MDGLIEYAIPVKGLGNGIHEFHFRIGEDFFSHFEGSPIKKGNVEVDLTFDKRTDMFVFIFSFEGKVQTECDRCLVGIHLPIGGEERLIVKFSLDNQEEDAEVIYVNPEVPKINVARYIYEFIILAIPIIKVYDCEAEDNPPCNEEMLGFLEINEYPEEEKKDTSNPIWEELKKFNPEEE